MGEIGTLNVRTNVLVSLDTESVIKVSVAIGLVLIIVLIINKIVKI